MTDCFEQLAFYANDRYQLKKNLFFDQFSHFLKGCIIYFCEKWQK